MIIRPFQEEEDDAARVAEIQRDSPEASQWSVQSDSDDHCLVIEQDRVMGFLLCRQIAPDEFELLNMAVDPTARRQGVARKLLLEAMDRFAGVWFLEVRESNLAAQKLYESLGFRECGRRAAYYSNPTESGIVMKHAGDCYEE